MAVALIVACVTVPSSAEPFDPARAERAAHYLAERQQPDGTLQGYGAGNATIGEVVVALVAGRAPPEAIARALAYLRDKGPAQATRGAYAGRLILGIVAAGENPRSYGGFDYVAKLRSYYDPATGLYDAENLYANALASLGILTAGQTLPAQAIRAWKLHQCRDGGWALERNCAGPVHVDTSALALSVLVGAKVPASDSARSKARAFLVNAENNRGGFGQGPGEETNGNSTGLALSAIAALGEDPERAPWHRQNGRDPLVALTELQDASGGMKYVSSDQAPNDYATVQAVPGLAGLAYPLRGTAPTNEPTPAQRRTPGPSRAQPSVLSESTTSPSVSPSSATPEGTGSPEPPRPGSVRALDGSRSDESGRSPVVVGAAVAALAGAGAALALALRARTRSS